MQSHDFLKVTPNATVAYPHAQAPNKYPPASLSDLPGNIFHQNDKKQLVVTTDNEITDFAWQRVYQHGYVDFQTKPRLLYQPPLDKLFLPAPSSKNLMATLRSLNALLQTLKLMLKPEQMTKKCYFAFCYTTVKQMPRQKLIITLRGVK